MWNLDFFVRLLRWRAFIVINTGLVAVLAVVISLLLPNWYAARVSVMPPQEEPLTGIALSGNLGSALGMAQQAAATMAGRTNLPIFASPSDYLVGILRSRTLRLQLIEAHDLTSRYETENVDQTLKVLADRIHTRVGREGIVHVELLDKEPETAAAMAASALEILDRIQRDTRRSRAADVSRFVAERLAATEQTLSAAEESLQAFEQRYGLLAPEEQAAALVRTIAELEAQRLAARVERDALSTQLGAEHPDVQRLDALVKSYEQARATLERGAATGEEPEGPTALIDLQRLPELSLAYLRRLREVEIQAALYELLTQIHEQYRIQEVRDLSTIQILDPPAVPQEKASPHRAIICVVATLLAFLASVSVAALLERLAMVAETDPARYEKLARLLRGLGLRLLLRRRGAA